MKYLEDFEAGGIDHFGSYLMTKEEVIEFATRFDPQPFHIDEAAGAAHPMFKKLSASGWHTAAATMRMIVDRNRELGVAALGSPGLDHVNWPTPTYPGDTLSVRTEVLEVRQSKSRPEMGFVKSRTSTIKQDGTVAMIFSANVMVATRP